MTALYMLPFVDAMAFDIQRAREKVCHHDAPLVVAMREAVKTCPERSAWSIELGSTENLVIRQLVEQATEAGYKAPLAVIFDEIMTTPQPGGSCAPDPQHACDQMLSQHGTLVS